MTKTDLLNVMNKCEESIPIRYIEAKAYSTTEIKEYASLAEDEDVGINKSGNHLSERFLIVEEEDR